MRNDDNEEEGKAEEEKEGDINDNDDDHKEEEEEVEDDDNNDNDVDDILVGLERRCQSPYLNCNNVDGVVVGGVAIVVVGGYGGGGGVSKGVIGIVSGVIVSRIGIGASVVVVAIGTVIFNPWIYGYAVRGTQLGVGHHHLSRWFMPQNKCCPELDVWVGGGVRRSEG
ncbi:hypothetical protein ElyMa_005730700 [Elysia marginata]|uniref:Uncharacterized protein n=1 Tax=Elysia marginata TaxID=1093978 RepID=A0AAV4FKI7_9GAST|nr:hypothetical protein ElyMa_005730700 [Elysia marginata]